MTVKSNVGGAYSVRVVMSPADAVRYRDLLQTYKQTVERQISGQNGPAEQSQLWADLARINAAVHDLESGGAGCTGHVGSGSEVLAHVEWQGNEAGGIWDAACGSSS